MDLSVKQKLWAFAAFSIIATLMVGLVGYHGEKAQGDALKVLNVQLSALRNHMEADMMHDALRADVLSALRAAASGDADARREVESDLKEHIANFEAVLADNQALPLSGDVKDALGSVAPALQSYETAANTIVQQAFTDSAAAEKLMPDFLVAFGALEQEMGKVSDLVEDKAKQAEASAVALAARSVMLMSVVILGAAIAALVVSYFLVRSVVNPLDTLRAAIEALRGGDSSGTRLSGFKHEFAGVEHAFNGVLDDLDAQHRAEQLRAQAAFRVQQALNAATTNVVLSDERLDVVYVNDTARAMFERYAADLRKDLPGFDTAQMIGRGVEQFYAERGMRDTLQRLTTPRTDEVVLGGKTFSVTATPVRGAQGEQLGVVCEWVDLTEQREAEHQIQAVLADATAGRLDSRLEAERFRGFTRALALSVNQMMDAVTAPLNVAAAHLSAIADGKLPAPITAEFHGAFNDIKNNLNTCSEVLRAMVEDATTLVEAAQAGRLEERASLERHWGDFRKIVAGMNNMLDSVAQPITAARTVMTALAAGDLSQRMEGDYQGEFAVLRDAMDASIANLANMVKRIGDSSSSIGSSASEIAKGNQDLNRRTQEQAASIEETTSAIQSLTTRVQENTENARRANQLAASARTEAEKGGKVVADAIGAMGEINSASAKIADIISVIDGIAFQTNLLALNAAVEAARAGEQGRGFAVVASEVRNLAQNSAAAAKEIKDLIGDSVDKVTHGTQLVNESGSTLRDIVGAVKNVSDIIAEITAASEEQQVGIEQVNRALVQLDEVTQQNAALVEEATAASESMDDETRSLTDLMAFFQGGAADDVAPRVEATEAPRVERRKANRPWSERAAPVIAPAASQIAAGGNGSDVWNEF